MICRMDFDMFFGILIFDPKWGFCMMADFQNALNSPIFGVYSSNFLHRTTLNDLYNGFWHVCWNFNFWPKVRIWDGLQPLHDGRFSKCSHFSNNCCFFERFSEHNISKWYAEWILTCYFEFEFLNQSADFAWAIPFAWRPILKIRVVACFDV